MMSSSTNLPSASRARTTETPSSSLPAPALTISSFSVNLGAGMQSEIAVKHGPGGDKVLYMTLDKFGELKLKVTAAARDMSLTREKNNKFKFYRHGRQGVSPGVPLFPDNVSSLQVIIHQLN